ERVRNALDAVAVPAVSVDVSRVFQQAAALQQRRARRWRRAAVAACGLAAALLLVVLLRLELQLDAHQLIVRWGEVPQGPPLVRPPTHETMAPLRGKIVLTTEFEEHLGVLRATVLPLAGSLETGDAQLRLVLDERGTRFAKLQMQVSRRWSENDRQFAALY